MGSKEDPPHPISFYHGRSSLIQQNDKLVELDQEDLDQAYLSNNKVLKKKFLQKL